MAAKPLPSPEVLRQLLRYDPDAGLLFWRDRPDESFSSLGAAQAWRTRFLGKPAGSDAGSGYLVIRMFGKGFKAHRVAWAMVHGCWPSDTVDHRNGDRSDNRIDNLRDVPRVENSRNVGRTIRNTSGEVGVHWRKDRRKWGARIKVNGKIHSFGDYDTFEDAVAARRSAAAKMGFSPQHGRRPARQL